VDCRRGDLSLLAGLGLPSRQLFAHDVIGIAKPYPDSQLLLERRGMPRFRLKRGVFWQLNLYTRDMCGLPAELFTDRQVNWHGQQFGRIGLVAAAGLYLQASSATIAVLQSDLCQQLYRQTELRRACKTRLEIHFKRWYVILFNAILDFCAARDLAVVYCPTGDQVVRNTQKTVSPALFKRVYDFPAKRYRARKTTLGSAEYWEIPLAENTERIVRLTSIRQGEVSSDLKPEIAIFHDIEENVDTPVPAADCAKHLAHMLRIERQFGIDATYDILGLLFDAKKRQISASNERHAIAFHSYDHGSGKQLGKCREIDLQVRGYRAPRSRLTSELADYNLTFLNFEWLASSESSLRSMQCRLQNGVVKIPIHLDDYPLYRGTTGYEDWENRILSLARENRFVAIGLHDCYGEHWLPQYESLLQKLGALGRFVTADNLRDGMVLGTRLGVRVAAHAPRRAIMGRLAGLFAR